MIQEKVKKILEELPTGVKLVAATKGRNINQIEKAIAAGIKIIGENYIQEAKRKFQIINHQVKWHFIGHLQKNKVREAVELFEMIETLDSIELAKILDQESKKINKMMPVLIEVNSASEPQKYGILPGSVDDFVKEILKFKNLKLMGLMTMGPLIKNPEEIRPFFKKTKEIFDQIKNIYQDKLNWDCLSMGMSDSYRIALEEGANLIRIGSAIFGPTVR